MTDMKRGPNPLFLREEDLREGMALLAKAGRLQDRDTQSALAHLKLGPADFRIISLIGVRPKLTVAEAIRILGITKQSFSRVLTPLVRDGIIIQHVGLRDRRQRVLELSERGIELERALSDAARRRLARAYREAGAEAVEGFRKVMFGLMDVQEREALRRPVTPIAPVAPGKTHD